LVWQGAKNKLVDFYILTMTAKKYLTFFEKEIHQNLISTAILPNTALSQSAPKKSIQLEWRIQEQNRGLQYSNLVGKDVPHHLFSQLEDVFEEGTTHPSSCLLRWRIHSRIQVPLLCNNMEQAPLSIVS
jgi:hypothetical protein